MDCVGVRVVCGPDAVSADVPPSGGTMPARDSLPNLRNCVEMVVWIKLDTIKQRQRLPPAQ